MAPARNKRRNNGSGASAGALALVKFQSQDFEKLRLKYTNTKEKYIDEKFPPEKRSIGSGLLSQDEMANLVWKRPSELVEDPCLVVDGESRFDFAQGELGNCWFLAAIGAITFQKEIMDKIVPVNQGFGPGYPGVFHFRFWKSGKWIDVVIDDKLPTINGELIFLNCKTRNEFWPALLEKAYAKVCGSYAAMQGGYISAALKAFTGGEYQFFSLSEASDSLWDVMDKAAQGGALMGCGTPRGPTSANTVLPNGIVQGHAYTVTGVTKVKTPSKEVQLVRILNPWGEGEWNRDWSDKSALWKQVSVEDRKRLLEDKNDGEFWMSMKDFCKFYSDLDICYINSTLLEESPPAPKSSRAQL